MLFYNLLLATAKKGNRDQEQPSFYQDLLDHWWDDVCQSPLSLPDWDLENFWTGIRQLDRDEPQSDRGIPGSTVQFCSNWIRLVLSDLQSGWQKNRAAATELIRNREYQLKRRRARLFNSRALENWNGNAGTQQLNYRWPIAQALLKDILTPRQ